MFIQGDLQAVFDALYAIGVIDPVLKMDWSTLQEKMQKAPEQLKGALKALNLCAGDLPSLVQTLKSLDSETTNFVALEVARELAEFTDRKVLH